MQIAAGMPQHVAFRNHGCRHYHWYSSGLLMRSFLVEITAKLIIRSDTDPDELPANIYSQLAEFVQDEEIVDLEVAAFPLPGQKDDGSSH